MNLAAQFTTPISSAVPSALDPSAFAPASSSMFVVNQSINVLIITQQLGCSFVAVIFLIAAIFVKSWIATYQYTFNADVERPSWFSGACILINYSSHRT